MTEVVPRDEGNLARQSRVVWSGVGDEELRAAIVYDDSIPSSGNGSTHYDPVLFVGSNVGPGGSRPVVDRGGAWLAIEGAFWTNVGFDNQWRFQSEIHLQTSSNTGVVRRLFTACQSHTSGQTDTGMHGDSWGVKSGENTQEIWYSPGSQVYIRRQLQILGNALFVGLTDGTSDAFITLQHKKSGAGGVRLNTEDGTRWALQMSGGDACFLRDCINGIMHATFQPGAGTTGTTTFVGSVKAKTFTPTTLPVVTGSRSDGTALASLLTALETIGLIDDQSTA